MLYVFHGTDTDKARAHMHAVLEGAKKKRPDAEVFRVEAEQCTADRVEEFVGSMGLFERKIIAVLDRVMENKEAAAAVLARVEALQASDNLFLLIETKLDKKTLTSLEKHAYKVEAFAEAKAAGYGSGYGAGSSGGGAGGRGDFNTFALADALARRDRKQLWSLLQKASFHEIPAEEICGILFWQVKALALASEAGSTPASSGLAPFAFSKAKSAASKFRPEDLRRAVTFAWSWRGWAHRHYADVLRKPTA